MLEERGAAARAPAALEEAHVEAPRGQQRGRRQTADAASDDDHVVSHES
jgi:hypothetical protein